MMMRKKFAPKFYVQENRTGSHISCYSCEKLWKKIYNGYSFTMRFEEYLNLLCEVARF